MTFQSCLVIKESTNDIHSLDVFLFHQTYGYTTSSAYNKYIDLKKNQTPIYAISQDNITNIGMILNKYIKRKLIQNKLGNHVVFATIRYIDGSESAIYVCPAANNCMIIGNLSLRSIIIVNDSNDVQYLYDLFMFDRFE